ncbi:MAG: CxxxxCH/CxxCH domain c-type cytochrome, partial [Deferrisomatales bacterium]
GNTLGTHYVSGTGTGVCEVCHSQTSYYKKIGDGLTHPSATPGDCSTCHPHTKSLAPNCTGCHGFPPPAAPFSGTTATWNSDDGGGRATVGAHTTHASGGSPYVSGDCNSTCHVATNHLTDKLSANMGVKAATAAASTGVYKYSAVDNFDAWVGGTLAGNVSVVDDSCNNIVCHSPYYNNNAARSATPYPYQRYWVGQWDCYTCHPYDGTTASSRPTKDAIGSGSHPAHLGRGPLLGSFACAECHADNLALGVSHKNGTLEFDFDTDPYGATEVVSAALQPPTDGNTGAGHRAYATCRNVYCHSSVQTAAGGPLTGLPGEYATPAWGTTVGCGDCHQGTHTQVGEVTSGSHSAHRYSCSVCHYSTLTGICSHCHMPHSGGPPRSHVNGAIEVPMEQAVGPVTLNGTFDTDNNTLTDEGGAVPGAGYGQCTNVYCHSDARARKAGTATSVTYGTIRWGAGALTCESCHGSEVANALGAYAYGAPDYANGGTGTRSANSHGPHVAGGIACAACHNSVTADTDPASGWIFVASAPHADGNLDVEVAPTYDTNGATSNYDAATQTCAAVNCHGAGAPRWGGAVQCSDCHFRTAAAGGDRDDWVVTNGVVAAVSSDDWAATGHGRTGTAYPSGNPAAALAGPAADPSGCAYCHSFVGTAENPLVGHGQAANPFRLANRGVLARGATADGGWNDACLVCHMTGKGPYDPDGAAAGYGTKTATKKVDQNHYGAKHTDATKGGTFCWDCHDPHGDAQHYMVQGGPGVTAVSDGLYGLPVTRRPVTGFDVVGGTPPYSSSDLVNAGFTGLCQTCHTAASYYNQTTNTALSLHNGADATRCTVCHLHTKGFGAACTRCHGTDRTVAPTAPQVVWQNGTASGKTTAWGSHLQATTAETLNNESGGFDWTAQCNQCHTGHGGPVAVPLPPTAYTDGVGTPNLDMRTLLGINYTTTGGIHLGGTATSGSTEAELCWSCHYDQNLSDNAEFGVNNNVITGSMPYNYGTLSTWNATRKGSWWENEGTSTPATWSTAQTANPSFSYKNRTLQSMHAANLANPVQGLKPTSTLRCSYCHDVHDLNRASRTTGKGTYADTVSGPPYLRGTWKGNPYPEDGAPQNTTTYGNDFCYGPMPRSSATQSTACPAYTSGSPTSTGVPRNTLGGYQIDQNNGNITTGGSPAHLNPAVAGWQLSAQAGLCVLCHGDSVDTMNQFGNPADDWIGPLLSSANSSTASPNLSSNGHANAAIGGSGKTAPQASNIYDELIRNQTNKPFTKGATPYRAGAPALSLRQLTNVYRPSSFRSQWRGFNYPPYPNYRTKAYQYYNWGATADGATLDNQYHKFPCAKCHAPHAAKLPRLLTTNCLDVKHATWGSGYGVYGPAGTTNSYAPTWPISAENGSVNHLNNTAAQNCHRLPDKARFPNALGLGWNRVTPW